MVKHLIIFILLNKHKGKIKIHVDYRDRKYRSQNLQKTKRTLNL